MYYNGIPMILYVLRTIRLLMYIHLPLLIILQFLWEGSLFSLILLLFGRILMLSELL